MSRGLLDSGIDVIGAFDNWPLAVETYRRNLGTHVVDFDLSDLLGVIPEIMKLSPDMIFGGPPCQDYSSAGKRSEGQNASLTVAFAIVVATVRPTWFAMENVVTAAASNSYAQAKRILEKAGYGISESKVKAEHYGVPQKRRRLFVVGRLHERHGFLQSAIARAASPQPMVLRDMFPAETSDVIYFHPRHRYKRAFWGLDDSAPTIRSASDRPVPRSIDLTKVDFVFSRPVRGARGVRSLDEPLPTITRTSNEAPADKYLGSPHRDDPVDVSGVAPLTIPELALVQGFPADWIWPQASKRDLMQMIANAVPPPVAKRIGMTILDRHRGLTMPETEGRFLEWLVRGGKSRATARNVKANLGRARRMLGGRTFGNSTLEETTLESIEDFAMLRKGTRSDLRQALRLYVEFLNEKAIRKNEKRLTHPIQAEAKAA